MDVNYNKKLNNIINQINITKKPNLFLHVCCGPCSSAVLEKLYYFFNIYIIFYNPNIDTKDEFVKRYNELNKIFDKCNYKIPVLFNDYNHNDFLNEINGLENEPEGGKRCEKCFYIRLKKTFEIASEYVNKNNLHNNINYICTTLSISPHKNAVIIEKIGEKICNDYKNQIEYLPSDFKKENGYLNSIKLSYIYGLYRQNYCGCEFSKMHK